MALFRSGVGSHYNSIVYLSSFTSRWNDQPVKRMCNHFSITGSNITFLSEEGYANSGRLFKYKVSKQMTVNIECFGYQSTQYLWESVPFFDVYNERIGIHYTSGSLSTDLSATYSVLAKINCNANDIICVKQWFGDYQYGNCVTNTIIYN